MHKTQLVHLPAALSALTVLSYCTRAQNTLTGTLRAGVRGGEAPPAEKLPCRAVPGARVCGLAVQAAAVKP